MGDKTFTSFQTDLKLELGNWSPSDDKYDNWINDAYMTLATMTRFIGKGGRRYDMYFPELEGYATEAVASADSRQYISMPPCFPGPR